jgi:hypothetical protein
MWNHYSPRPLLRCDGRAVIAMRDGPGLAGIIINLAEKREIA